MATETIDLFGEIDVFCEREDSPISEHEPPGAINSGYCEEFADFVRNNGHSDLKKTTTADIVDETDDYPQTEDGNIEPWHVWLTDGTYYYDAECPHGVSDWNQLPFFNRHSLSDYRTD